MIPAIIDVEASGFGRHSYPIEIGVAMPDGSRHCYLIHPEEEWTFWADEAEEIHGISRRLLLERGQPADQVGRLLNRLLGGMTVYSDAWGHDTSWLGKLYDAAGLPQLFRLESLRRLLTEDQAALWHPTKEQVMQETQLERHRASADAMILQMTWRRICLPAGSPEGEAAAGEAAPAEGKEDSLPSLRGARCRGNPVKSPASPDRTGAEPRKMASSLPPPR